MVGVGTAEANRVREVEAELVGGGPKTGRPNGRGCAYPTSGGGIGEVFEQPGAPGDASGESVAGVGRLAAVSVRDSGVGTLTRGPGEKTDRPPAATDGRCH